MPYVVSLVDYIPIQRYDGLPWTQARIEEAFAADGPWAELGVFPLTPLDADPKQPMPRDFTVENATMSEGWYRVIFEDASGDTQLPTEPIQNLREATLPYIPLVSDIGAVTRARTKDNNGVELGTFTDTTRPTDDDVRRLIEKASYDMYVCVGADIPPEAYRLAQTVITLRTAQLVELSHFPEQVASGRSPYEQYKAMYDEEMLCLQTFITGTGVVEGDAASVAFNFPYASPLWERVM